MSNPKTSEPPWLLATSDSPGRELFIEQDAQVHQEPAIIAEVSADGPGIDRATGEANGHLLAAAPVLRSAVQSALNYFNTHMPMEHGDPELGRVWGALESALSEANPPGEAADHGSQVEYSVPPSVSPAGASILVDALPHYLEIREEARRNAKQYRYPFVVYVCHITALSENEYAQHPFNYCAEKAVDICCRWGTVIETIQPE